MADADKVCASTDGTRPKEPTGKPRYSRVISWELSRTSEEDFGMRKKRRPHGKHMKDKVSSESSELSSEEESVENSGSDDDVDQELSNDTCEPLQVHEMDKPTITKKGKQRMVTRQLELARIELGGIDLDADVQLPESMEDLVLLAKPVPSLVDLCLRVDWKMYPEHELKICNIAPGLRHLVRTKQQMCQINSMYLKSYHKTLASREKYPEVYLKTRDDNNQKLDKKEWTYQRAVTSVGQFDYSGAGYSRIRTLADTNLQEWGSRNQEGVLDDLIQTMDLMLPALIGERDAHQDDTLQNVDPFKVPSILGVKAALRKRYPGLIDYLYNEAVPYVWWSRGIYNLAKLGFLHLAKINEGNKRAVYLNEIGRLHLYQNDADNAVEYFRQAESLVKTTAPSLDALSIQTLLLCANAYDQGIMSPCKVEKAQRFWEAVTKCYGIPASFIRYAVETFLYIRVSGYSDGASKLTAARDEIQTLAKKYGALYYHLSCIDAMLGEELWVIRSLQNTVFGSTTWTPVLEQKKKGVLLPFKLQWRTQLLAPALFFVDDPNISEFNFSWDNYVADIHQKPLQLRISYDGYLTGNMKMLYPAMRSILLNPYTGLISYPEVPLRPESVIISGSDRAHNLGSTPIPHHFTILEKPDGTIVEYIESHFPAGTYYALFSQTSILKLTLPSGKVHQVDILAIARKHEYLSYRQAVITTKKKEPKKQQKPKNWKKQLKQQKEEEDLTYYEREFTRRREEYKGSDQWKKDCLDLLRKLYKQKKRFEDVNYLVEQQFLKKLHKDLSKDPKCKLKYKSVLQPWGTKKTEANVECLVDNDFVLAPHSAEDFSVSLLSYKVYGGNTVALTLNVDNYSQGLMLVIFNCKDENSFEDPKVYTIPAKLVGRRDRHWAVGAAVLYYSHDDDADIDIQLMVPNSPDTHHPDANVVAFCQVTYSDPHIRLYIFDENGDVLREDKLLNALRQGANIGLCCVIGKNLYGITQNRRRVFRDHIEFCTASQKLEYRIGQLQSFKEHLILGTNTGLAFMNKDLEICEIDITSTVSKSESVRVVLSDDGNYLKFEGDNTAEYKCKILNRQQTLTSSVPLIIGYDSHVLVIGDWENKRVSIRQHVEVPGRATEAHYITDRVGFVVSCTLSQLNDGDYREHVLHFDNTSTLQSMLPFLYQAPRDFFSVRLPGCKATMDKGDGTGKSGWYLYMNDGHGGLISIYLNSD